ncbi:hypothetical protein EV197_1020 [Aquimarina brevivitae]|uniref:Uncharacterized protein n=2 Tax=Aquimarina brevivitae TaxID=323412 RepID=A0A4Q7PGX6_9FLAO|nr:hypothetical protein EV197_1020 [Aquimarina brevivitae]
MTVVLLLSTFSFTIQKHYCGATLVDTAWFVKAEDCGMKGMDSLSMMSSNDNVKRKSCCKDELIIIQGQNELKNNLHVYKVNQTSAYVAPIFLTFEFIPNTETQRVLFINNPIPPPPSNKLHKLYETYLI